MSLTLSESVAGLVHEKSLEILFEVGFCVPEQEALTRLQAAGFPVTWETQMVRLTPELVQGALQRLPRDVRLYDRVGLKPAPFGQSPSFMGGGTPVNVLDLEAGQRRPATRRDVRNLVTIQDALAQVVNPGTPIIYGTGAAQLDMRTGHFGTSADGHAMRLALCDLARYYDLPVNLWGLSTSSSSLDALYGHEATTYGLLAQLAGVDEVYSLGLLGSAQILSLDKMVLDNHLARQNPPGGRRRAGVG